MHHEHSVQAELIDWYWALHPLFCPMQPASADAFWLKMKLQGIEQLWPISDTGKIDFILCPRKPVWIYIAKAA